MDPHIGRRCWYLADSSRYERSPPLVPLTERLTRRAGCSAVRRWPGSQHRLEALMTSQGSSVSVARQPGRYAPVRWQLGAVLLASLFPIFVEVMPHEDAFLLSGMIFVGNSAGVALNLALFHKNLVAERTVLRLLLRRAAPWRIGRGEGTADRERQMLLSRLSLVCICAQISMIPYVLSTNYVDTAVTAILNAAAPILFVVLLSRQDRTVGRYRKLTAGTFGVLLLAFAGLTLVVLGTTDLASSTRPARLGGLVIGLLLALLAPVLISFSARAFRWGSEMASDLCTMGHASAADRQRTESACVLLAIGVGSLGASVPTLVIALGTGERMGILPLAAAFAYGLIVQCGTAVCHRTAMLRTRSLSISALSYATPLFGLLWLWVFSDIQVANIDYVLIGAVGIVTANLLLARVIPSRSSPRACSSSR